MCRSCLLASLYGFPLYTGRLSTSAELAAVATHEDFSLGVPMVTNVDTERGFKQFALGADELVRAAATKFCNWHFLGMMATQQARDVFSSAVGEAAPCVDVLVRDMAQGAREKKGWVKQLSGRTPWPIEIPLGGQRLLLSMDDQINIGLIIAAWADLGYSEMGHVSSEIPRLAAESDFDVLWSLFPQQGRSVSLSYFLGIPVDWSYYGSNLPSWDLQQMRPNQTHNHCLPFHGAPIGPKHNLAKGIQSLNEYLHTSGYVEEARRVEECVAQLCYPESYVVMKGSMGFDDFAKAREELLAGKKLVAKASHSSGGGSITVLRSARDLDALLQRASLGSQFLVQRLLKSVLIEGRRFHFRLYIGLTSVNPLRIYIHHNKYTGGYATLAKKSATIDASENLANEEEHNFCSQGSGVCTLERDREFVTNYGSRQIPQGEFLEIYRNMTGADPDELLRRMHHSAVAMILSASHYSRRAKDFQERLQSLLGGGRCFEILGIDFLFEDNSTHTGGSGANRSWIPYLIDVTPSCGYGRPTAEASHDMLRDFFRAFVSRDPIPGLQPSNRAAFEKILPDFAKKAASRGLWYDSEDEAHLRDLQLEEDNSGASWLRIFPPIPNSPVGMPEFDYTPLFAGGPSRANALAMIWAGSPLSTSSKGVELRTKPVDEAMTCYFERVGEHRISASDEYLLTQVLRSTLSNFEMQSLPKGVVTNVPSWLADFMNTDCIDSEHKIALLKVFVR